MRTLEVDPADPDPRAIARAAEILRGGGLVAFPTETVYGLGASALDEAAVRRVFEAKGRPSYNPLIVHVPDAEGARRLTGAWPDAAGRLAEAFWPGPLTMVLPRAAIVPDVVTAGLSTVAVRVPAHAVALALLRAAAVPVVAPSANPSTMLSPTRADHVARGLGERLDLILDGGATELGIESTVVDLSGPGPVLLRPGVLSAADLEPYTGPLAQPGSMATTAARPAPGMLDRHYAPRASLHLFDPADRVEAARHARRAAAAGQRVGAVLIEPLDAPVHHAIHLPPDPGAYARELYAALHRLDELGCDLVLAEQAPDTPAWAGVRDRLRRAAAAG